jgi:hypothetical protein
VVGVGHLLLLDDSVWWPHCVSPYLLRSIRVNGGTFGTEGCVVRIVTTFLAVVCVGSSTGMVYAYIDIA